MPDDQPYTQLAQLNCSCRLPRSLISRSRSRSSSSNCEQAAKIDALETAEGAAAKEGNDG